MNLKFSVNVRKVAHKKLKKKKFHKCCFSADMAGYVENGVAAKTPKIVFFFTFSAKFRPLMGKKYAFFFWSTLDPILPPKKFLGCSGHFWPILRIFGQCNPFSANFTYFGSKMRFLRFFSKVQVEISLRVSTARKGLRYEKYIKIFELSEKFEKKGLAHPHAPKTRN